MHLSLSSVYALQRFMKARIDLLIIMAASLYTLSWFQPETIYISGDLFLPLSRIHPADVYSAWSNRIDFGYPAFNIPLQVLWQGFFHSLLLTGLSILDAERIYFVITFFFSGLGMEYLVKTVAPQNGRLAHVLSALLYIYNPYIMISFVFIPMYATFPWLLALFIKALRRGEIKYAIAAGLLSLIIFLNFPNPLHPFLAIGVILFLAVFWLAYERSSQIAKRVGVVIIVAATVSIAVNLWWIFPTLNILPQLYAQGSTGGLKLEEFGKGVTVIFDVFRLMGSWGFHAGFEGKPYVPYGDEFYTNPIVLVATFSIPLLVFAAIYLRKNDRFTAYFSLLSVFFLFLVKGSNPPLGDFYSWSLRNIPLFAAFRDPYKFMAIATLSYSVLYGISTVEILNRIRSGQKMRRARVRVVPTLFIGLVLCSIFISAWPMVTGDIIVNWYNPPNHGVKIPDYYYDADSSVSQNLGFRVLSLPRKNIYSAHTWGYQGTDIMPNILSQPVVTGLGTTYSQLVSFSSRDVVDELYINVYRQYLAAENLTELGSEIDCLAEQLGIYSIKYIIVDESVVSSFYPSMPVQESLNAVTNRQGIVHEATFGQLQIFRNQRAKPIIHGASKPVMLSAPPQSTSIYDNEVIIYHLKNNFDSTAIFLENQNDRSSIEALLATLVDCSNPTINFERIHPTEYIAHINASTPFILIFTESFDLQWKAYLGNEELGLHMVVNACSNAWVLDKTGQYDIRIKYVQQDLLVAGTILSTSVFIGCSTLIVAKTRGEQIKKHCKKVKEKLTRTEA